MHKAHVMKLSKNEKNKKRFVFLLFFPETDEFLTRLRPAAQCKVDMVASSEAYSVLLPNVLSMCYLALFRSLQVAVH